MRADTFVLSCHHGGMIVVLDAKANGSGSGVDDDDDDNDDDDDDGEEADCGILRLLKIDSFHHDLVSGDFVGGTVGSGVFMAGSYFRVLSELYGPVVVPSPKAEVTIGSGGVDALGCLYHHMMTSFLSCLEAVRNLSTNPSTGVCPVEVLNSCSICVCRVIREQGP
eukprot:TRINITY_DN2576_c0_g1_i5.p1 TRINITY_DN2576_c0_g1~~TRINITY_DN2576_c0_g1_i5.p1  ORF type:complete len:166 (+),score=23.72 TRINITY_DN2576_c0_g1_i5:644-1141(+)